jgi:hypothetical protein
VNGAARTYRKNGISRFFDKLHAASPPRKDRLRDRQRARAGAAWPKLANARIPDQIPAKRL